MTRRIFPLPYLRRILVIAVFLAASAMAETTPPLKLLKTIPLSGVEGRFDHFSMDSKTGRLFVAALGNNTVEVLDFKNQKWLRHITELQKPTGVLFVPEYNRLCIANGADGSLKIFDGTSLQLLETVSGLDDADNLRFDSRKKLIYVGYADGAIAAIDALKARTVSIIKLKAHPESFQLEQEGERLFVNVPDSQQIVVIDREKHEPVATWATKHKANFPMALAEEEHLLFVGFRNPARLLTLDTTNGKSLSDIEISGDADDLFYDAKRKRIYISCGAGFVDVVQVKTRDCERIARIPTVPGARTSFFSAADDEFYLAVPHRGPQPAELRIYQPSNPL